MKIAVAAITAVVYSISTAAQESRTGVSIPPPMTIDAAAPSSVTNTSTSDGYRPTPPTQTSSPAMQRREAMSEQRFEDAGAIEPATRPAAAPKQDIDALIVTGAAHAANECPAGTMLRARMQQTLSTASTAIGTPFSAELTEAIEENGRILIPAGTVLDGRVTEVRGGRRIHGIAALHLEPRKLTLPDGTRYTIHGQVIDTSESFATRIDSEGTILRRDHIKTTLAGIGLATGGAVVAGAVLGGGVGAVVGLGVGAGLSTAWWLKQDRQTVLPQDTAIVFSLNEALAIGVGATSIAR